jgi:DnaJ family protein C protein 28
MPNIEELLRKAMEEGKFDNLPGKGQPLHLDKINPHADPDWELAYQILKEAGYSLPWIETLRAIEADLAAARQDQQLAWQVFRQDYAQQGATSLLADSWERSQRVFRDRLASLNKRIRDYNLAVPSSRFQRPVLDFEGEVKKIKERKE